MSAWVAPGGGDTIRLGIVVRAFDGMRYAGSSSLNAQEGEKGRMRGLALAAGMRVAIAADEPQSGWSCGWILYPESGVRQPDWWPNVSSTNEHATGVKAKEGADLLQGRGWSPIGVFPSQCVKAFDTRRDSRNFEQGSFVTAAECATSSALLLLEADPDCVLVMTHVVLKRWLAALSSIGALPLAGASECTPASAGRLQAAFTVEKHIVELTRLRRAFIDSRTSETARRDIAVKLVAAGSAVDAAITIASAADTETASGAFGIVPGYILLEEGPIDTYRALRGQSQPPPSSRKNASSSVAAGNDFQKGSLAVQALRRVGRVQNSPDASSVLASSKGSAEFSPASLRGSDVAAADVTSTRDCIAQEGSTLQLLVDIKFCMMACGDSTELVMTLCRIVKESPLNTNSPPSRSPGRRSQSISGKDPNVAARAMAAAMPIAAATCIPLSEDYRINFTDHGLPADANQVDKLRACFRDVPADALKRGDLVIVCHIYRHIQDVSPASASANASKGAKGFLRALKKSDVKPSVPMLKSTLLVDETSHRKLLGCSVLPLSPPGSVATVDWLSQVCGTASMEVEHDLSVFQPAKAQDPASSIAQTRSRSALAALRQTTPVLRGAKIVLGLRLLSEPFNEAVEQYAHLLRGVSALYQLSFPEVIMPGLKRHDFYVTIVGGSEVSKSGKVLSASSSELEVLVELCRNISGERVDRGIIAGSGVDGPLSTGFYVTGVSSREGGVPQWHETINLGGTSSVNGDELHKHHIRFSVRSVTLSVIKDPGSGKMYQRAARVKEIFVGFLALQTSEGSLIENNVHSIPLYSMDDKSSKRKSSVPREKVASSAGISDADGPEIDFTSVTLNSPVAQSHLSKSTLLVRTTLCSTLSSSAAPVQQLRHWRDLPESKLPGILRKFTFVDAQEVLKFLTECFDAMFEILDEKGTLALGTKQESEQCYDNVVKPVFFALVFTIGILVDEKRAASTGVDLYPALESYRSEMFSGYPRVYKLLLLALRRVFCSERAFALDNLSGLIKVLKALEFLFKFMVTSRLEWLTCSLQDEYDDADFFKKDVLALFEGINILMQQSDKTLHGAQAQMIKAFADSVPELADVFDPDELAYITRDFLVASTSQNRSGLHLQNVAKLVLCQRIIESKLFEHESCRFTLFSAVLSLLIEHSATKDVAEQREVISCYHSLLLIARKIKQASDARIFTVYIEWLLSLLPSIIRALPLFIEQSRADMATALLSLLDFATEIQLTELLEKQDDASNFDTALDFIYRIVATFQSLLLVPVYPVNWIALNIWQLEVLRRVTGSLCGFVTHMLSVTDEYSASSFFTEPAVAQHKTRSDVWRQLFRLTGIFCSHALFQSSAEPLFANVPREPKSALLAACRRLPHDVMSSAAMLWHGLAHGNHKIFFLKHVASLFLDAQVSTPHVVLTSDDNVDVRQIAGELYVDALRVDFAACALGAVVPFPIVTSITIAALDKLARAQTDRAVFSARGSLPPSLLFFIANLRRVAQDQLSSDVVPLGKFIENISTMLNLQSDMACIPAGPEYEDDRVVTNLRLLEYLKHLSSDAYIRNIHSLVVQHEAAQRFAEAGCALMLHADLYSWDHHHKLGVLTGRDGLNLPAATDASRKAMLLTRAIALFDAAQRWERAIEICKELEIQFEYDGTSYGPEPNWGRLGALLRIRSALIRKILLHKRVSPEYFRVAFFGAGFDESLRNKAFVFVGNSLERRDDFVRRIQSQFPDAAVLQHTRTPDNVVQAAEGKQFVQITSVKPVSRDEALSGGLYVCESTDFSSNSDDALVLDGNQLRQNFVRALGDEPQLTENEQELACLPVAARLFKLHRAARYFVYSKPIAENEEPQAGDDSALRAALSRAAADVARCKQLERARKLDAESARQIYVENPVRSLWTRNEYFETEEAFPTTHRRALITRHISAVVSPLSNALKAVTIKNHDLEECTSRQAALAADPERSSSSGETNRRSVGISISNTGAFSLSDLIMQVEGSAGIDPFAGSILADSRVAVPLDQDFAMLVKGIIDAAVNGGPRMFRESFFTADFLSTHPDDGIQVKQLRAALRKQIVLLDSALPLHRLCCAPQMLPLQELLEEQFETLKTESRQI